MHYCLFCFFCLFVCWFSLCGVSTFPLQIPGRSQAPCCLVKIFPENLQWGLTAENILSYKKHQQKKKGCLSGCGVSACESKLGATLLSFQIYHFQQASRREASIRAAVAKITASQPTAASAGRSAAQRRDVLRVRHWLQLFVWLVKKEKSPLTQLPVYFNDLKPPLWRGWGEGRKVQGKVDK